MRHIEIAKEARRMILDRVPLKDKAEMFFGEVHYNKKMDPPLQAAVKEACRKQIDAYKEEEKLLPLVGALMAGESIRELPQHEQAAAYKDVDDILSAKRDPWIDLNKSSAELRAELSAALNIIKNAPEILLEQQDKSDPSPAQGMTLEEGHAVALDSLDQAIESHAVPPTEPTEGLSPSDPSGDIGRGIEQEKSRTEPPKGPEPPEPGED